MKKIYWLASYPKSGNTWMRIFLTNYMRNSDQPANINNLDTEAIVSSRYQFDTLAGIPASEMDPEMVDLYRPEIYRLLAAETKDKRVFIKAHDAHHVNQDGDPIFPEDVSKGVIYIIRHPFDVAVSFANHNAKSIDKTIQNMNDPEFAFFNVNDKIRNQLRQKIGTWSDHYLSWTRQKEIPLILIRYEDLLNDPEKTFGKVVTFCGWELDTDRLQRSIRFSDFNMLKQQEAEHGFHEKSAVSPQFFKYGKAGTGSTKLSSSQKKELLERHHHVMEACGYS